MTEGAKYTTEIQVFEKETLILNCLINICFLGVR